MLERLDFSDPTFTVDKQKALMLALEADGNYFRSLTLRNCSTDLLDDARLAHILESCESKSHLQYLSLSGCKGVGQEQKETGLFGSHPVTGSFLYLQSLGPVLRRLDLSETSVVSLRLSLPNLEVIRALNCDKLGVFDLKCPILSAVNISMRKKALLSQNPAHIPCLLVLDLRFVRISLFASPFALMHL